MRHVVRVLGLVKLAGQVREEIGRGVGAERKRALREAVARAVGQVDVILKEPQATEGSPKVLSTFSCRGFFGRCAPSE